MGGADTENMYRGSRCLLVMLWSRILVVRANLSFQSFILLYGRDPHIPTVEPLSAPSNPYTVDLNDYRSELVTGWSDAWKAAGKNIKTA